MNFVLIVHNNVIEFVHRQDTGSNMRKQSAKKQTSKASVHTTVTKKGGASGTSKTQNKKNAKPPQSLAWGEIEWQKWMEAALFTFSSKIVNSNAEEVGVRIGEEGSAKNLPYISAQSCNPDLDYVQQQYKNNNGKSFTNSSVFSELSQHLGKKNLDDFVPTLKPHVAQAHAQIKKIRTELNTSCVPSRVRQILIPHPDHPTGYISASPLSCSGMGEQLNQALKSYAAHWKLLKDNKQLSPHAHTATRMHLQYGGANPQNIGGLTRQLWNGLVLDNLPTVSPTVQRAFSLKHNGLQLSLPKILILDYFAWMGGQKTWTLETKTKEKALLQKIAAVLKTLAGQQRTILERIDADLLKEWKVERWEDLPLSNVDKGWLLESHHSPTWRQEAARDIVHKMKHVVVERRKDGQNVFMDLTAHESRIVKHLQEVLK